MVKVSIIVPVYNVEKYIDQSAYSLVNQSLKEIEIIVVNDGTKDDSQLIIDKYCENYPKLIRSFIKTNGGLSDARNYGVPYATGEYIAFVDSDDYVELDLYENMYNMAINQNLDLVVADIQYVWENNEKKPQYMAGLNKSYKVDINKQLFLSPLFSWNKLYRRKLFIDLDCVYPLNLWYEDIPVSLIFFANAKNIGYYNKVGFHYLQRSSSILASGYNKKMYDIFTIFEQIIPVFKKEKLYEQYKDVLEYLYIENFLLYGAFRFLKTDEYKELMLKGFSFVENEFPNWRKSKYLSHLTLKNKIFLKLNNRFTMSLWHKYLNRG